MDHEQQAALRARDAGRQVAELGALLRRLREGGASATDGLDAARHRARRAALRAGRAEEHAREAMTAAAVVERRASRLWESRGDLQGATVHARRAMERAAAGAADAASTPSSVLPLREVLQPGPSPAPAPLLDDEADYPPHTHEALVVASTEAFLEAVLPAAREALEAGHHLVLACSEANARALAAEVRDDARVAPTTMSHVHRDAAVALAFYRGVIGKRLRAGAPGVCLVTQAGAVPDRWEEWQRFEALCNHALAGVRLRQLCVYDTRDVTDAGLATAELCHPYLRDPLGRTANPGYLDPEEVLELAGPGRGGESELRPDLRIEDLHDFAGMRHLVRDLLRRHRLPGAVADEFVHAVHEVAANGVTHGVAPVSVSVWLHPRRLVCTVTDRGSGLGDPFTAVLAGRDQSWPARWVGLWVARRYCDELTTAVNDEGFTVRLVRLR